ncbi:hypothetical protein [Pseudoalteromonas luteoviolacea]|uniref:hypothetical protein n=1 Tax=Pseudoalteromonas luteoviolacea TaxID=43657 RepID=UPI001B374733|nr:hypothetical protein [Pseudoalteromonas luteoviolacea]MBQ4836022.1 hypothetical protein [Pseudoalteromonas luteoviolacea]
MEEVVNYKFACGNCGQEYIGFYTVEVGTFPVFEVIENHASNNCERCSSKIDIIFRYDKAAARSDYVSPDIVSSEDAFYVYSKSYTNALYSLKELSDYEGPKSDLIHRLFFSHSITILETYLSDLFKFFINNNFECFLKFLESSRHLKNEKYTLAEYLRNPSIALDKVNERLNSIVFHNLSSVDALFLGVFEVSLNSIIGKENRSVLQNIIEDRHDLVHRNGKSICGDVHEVSVSTKDRVITIIDDVIRAIYDYVTSLEIVLDRNKIHVWRYMDSI